MFPSAPACLRFEKGYISIQKAIQHNPFYFYQPEDFEANVTVNVTTLLVLTTLFISTSESLPRTAYVKMIDLWLIFNLLIPFVEIIVISFAHMFYKGEENDDDVGLFR